MFDKHARGVRLHHVEHKAILMLLFVLFKTIVYQNYFVNID